MNKGNLFNRPDENFFRFFTVAIVDDKLISKITEQI